MEYLYGLPAHLTRPSFPPEPGPGLLPDRYWYAAAFFSERGNDPELLVLLPRLVAAGCAVLLSLAVFLTTRRRFGTPSAVFALLLCAFLPDVLAHGGVAYSDVPLALCWICTLYATDAVVRDPSVRRAAVAGAWLALSLGTKFSAMTIAPAAVLLLLAEAASRAGDRGWRGAIIRAAAVAEVTAYLVLVALYRGDFTLGEMVRGLGMTRLHVSAGHDAAPAYLLGATSQDGWWYFFPVAFLLKTPAALHLLVLIVVVGLVRRAGGRPSADWRSRLRSPLRVPLVGTLIFGGSLLGSKLNIGFRYALPALPMLCVLVGVGLGTRWAALRSSGRAAVGAVCAWYVVSSLSYYPHFLSYLSEYWPWRDAGYRVLADSSLDWGQGLLELRGYMQKERIPRVYLSYFGSVRPEIYGVDYVPLPSFLALPGHDVPPGEPRPELAVISATNMAGIYLGQPFTRLHDRPPLAVLGHTMFVYPAADVIATLAPAPSTP
jgi:4-amino-4-deoxy-L-arabinose transferase-like glycosyltransferase